jgi:proton-coupled amino acid transporter
MPTPPTKPLNIGSPRTPPVPNIPRFGTPGLAGTPGSLGGLRPSGAGTPGSFTSGVAGGRLGTPDVNVHELPDEEKARVLRRHLMSREEREAAAAAGQAGAGSRRESDASAVRRPSTVVRRQDTEAFPVPFEAPGADVTYVPSSSHSTAQP